MSLTDPNSFENKLKSYELICCDGFGCSREAIESINVSAGTFGDVSLNLCAHCKKLLTNPVLRNPQYE